MTVRHYCQGIGDCHLLSFAKEDGTVFRMLIDCGVHSSVTGGSDLIDEIVADIKKGTAGKIDVLVVTHEHWDHVSGFSTANELFNKFEVGAIWLPWTENPRDPDAAELDRFKAQALSALQGVSRRLDAEHGLTSHMAAVRDGLQAVLGFQFGAKGEKVRAARNAAIHLAKLQPPLYYEPGTAPINIDGLPNLRIYVLGPPRSKAALKLEEKASEMYRLAGLGGGPFVRALNAALASGEDGSGTHADDACPFDGNAGANLSEILNGAVNGDVADFVKAHYSGPCRESPNHTAKLKRGATSAKNMVDQSWRRIDTDWMGIAADLAMQLDRGVNNTSLVLAFEVVDSGRVFLFPGDAQIGSWLSWEDVTWVAGGKTVKATDLLARTVYLKVAHHGSQNATPEAHGLELMADGDLSAFVPTNENDAKKVRWGEMPYHAIMVALTKKTGGRVIRADDAWLAKLDGKPDFAVPSGSISGVRSAARDHTRGNGGLWVELDIS